MRAGRARSVDSYPLPIDELKGATPTEKIDLSDKGLCVASAIIIASCIKGNESLKELMCAAFPPRFPANMSALAEHFHFARPRRSLRDNMLGDGWTALFKALCENKGDKIESWDLSHERVGLKTVEALAEYISVSPALKSVKYACFPAQCVMAR